MKRYLLALAAVSAFLLEAEAQAPTFTVTLNWAPPTQNTDGTPLTDLTGYRVYYSSVARPVGCNGTAATSTGCQTWVTGALKVDVPAPANNRVLTNQNLTPATTYFFSVVAIKSTGAVSAFSNEASKLTPDPRVPGAPTNVTVDIVFNVGT